MMDNIKSQEGKKTVVLNYDSSIIQKEINSINDICNFVNDYNMSKHPDMIEFLLKYKKIIETVEDLLSKEIKSK